ncbi:spore germination protein [Clostridium tagluense]|uniref:GerAB/ArcD/ProY family transporter n=1 Tax=Clostridium tagluense TaxID=360422 RepID=UPI001C6DECE0|nr:endospore germination permease [Clostridium tagluense]MBW9157369.1 spore germination protein [Clostridium tagluense]MCB2310824.1 spore germination protein [Clostridium tagluense]MCB2315678.1 spore germination protein [Clostridium tagluense]MCB2320678.1 spore germination protein [Clostridium tagluense]MCB2325417.1 spore germination protein [Clostridium tagluense]
MNEKNNLITSIELFFILVGCIIGMGVTSLPADVVRIAKQDGWISTIIGGIYPLYIVLASGIIIKRHPNSNIMNLSRVYFGKIIGNVLNLLFMFTFLFYIVLVISGSSNQLRAYSIYFIPHFKMVMIFAVVACYASIKGLKVLARFTTITFFLLCFIVVASSVTFKSASILNVKPFFGAGVSKILEGSLKTSFAYSNMELLLIIYPYVEDKKYILKAAYISALVVIFFHTWIVFTSIYFSGPDLVVKQLWPFSFVAESFKIPVVNNFRYVEMVIWITIAYKTMSIEFYAATKILNNITKIERKTICFLLIPVIFIFPLFMGNEVTRREISGKLMPWIILFNISYVTIIALLTLLIDKNNLRHIQKTTRK